MKENYVVFMTDKLPEFLNTDYLILKYDSDDTITMMILKKLLCHLFKYARIGIPRFSQTYF